MASWCAGAFARRRGGFAGISLEKGSDSAYLAGEVLFCKKALARHSSLSVKCDAEFCSIIQKKKAHCQLFFRGRAQASTPSTPGPTRTVSSQTMGR